MTQREVRRKLRIIRNGMKQRCYYPKHAEYKRYGDRGIKVCDEWMDAEKGLDRFVTWSLENGYEEGLTIDRIDYDGDYSPKNCRWVTPGIQSYNRHARQNKCGARGIAYKEKTVNGRKYAYYNPRICIRGKRISLGCYDTIEEAIAARKQAEMQYYGEMLKGI